MTGFLGAPLWKRAPKGPPPRERTVLGAYDTLRERLLLAANGKPLKTLVFAGCVGGEGCTRVVREFGETLAQSGLKVLLIDVDTHSSGLRTTASARASDLQELVTRGISPPAVPWGAGSLALVTSTVAMGSKEHFFRAEQFAAWLAAQGESHDYALVDAPPLLGFADATLIGRLSDGVVVIVRAEASSRESLIRARERLQYGRVRIVGTVLNGARDPVPWFLRPYVSLERD
jgi:Mrp family chromosome partitioning ATPase